MQKDKSKELLIFIIIVWVVLQFLLFGCTSERKIQERIKEGIRIDREINKCANDTLYKLIPGESLVLIDTVKTIWHDSIYNWTYDTTVIVKTVKKVDTIKAFIRDDYKINSLKDSVNVHKRSEANLQGQIYQEKLNTIEAQKTAKNRLWIIIGILVFVVGGAGLSVYNKIKL